MAVQKGGHPAAIDPAVAKLDKTMKAAVALVRDLDGKLSPGTHLKLRSSALGLMWAYSELTGLPSPVETLNYEGETP